MYSYIRCSGKYKFFFQELSKFCDLSCAPALGWYFFFRKWPANSSDCTLRSPARMSWYLTFREKVTVNCGKKTHFFLYILWKFKRFIHIIWINAESKQYKYTYIHIYIYIICVSFTCIKRGELGRQCLLWVLRISFSNVMYVNTKE